MKRRNFIKLSASAAAIGLLPLELNAMLKQLSINPCDFSNRKLVLVNLAGANDGLNTLIPINQYDIYSSLRPNIKVGNSGTNGYITLDSTLPDNQQIGLNPALTGFKSLYDQGWMRILQSVGYPSSNKSHFTSTDLYLTGNDGNSWLNGETSGWIGRYMELFYQNELNANYPLAVEIGSNKTSLGFHGENEHGMSINITGQDPAGFYSILNGLSGQAPTNIPNSDYGIELDYIIQTDALSNQYSQTISGAFNNGTNSGTYQDTDLSNQLKTVAKLISGGLDSKVYMVRISGFDTHNGQIEDSGNPNGKHYNLLQDLSSSVESFLTDLNNQGLAEDIVGLTFSEFGRKAAENGSLGTDHGEISPMFVFGKPIEGGVSGTNPDLQEATNNNNYQIETVQHDYRQTFGTILQNFLGVSSTIIDSTFFDHTNNTSFNSKKIEELIKDTHKVPASCYDDTLSLDTLEINSIKLYPNPFKTDVILKGKEDLSGVYQIYDLTGKHIQSGKVETDITNSTRINLQNLANGIYLFRLQTKTKVKTFKIIKE